AAMLLEQIHYRSRVANIQVVMFVVAKVRDQVAACFFRGRFGAKKLSADVVVDPKDMRAVSRETPHGFRANQSRRTCNDDRAHHVTRTDGFLAGVVRGEAILEFRRVSRDTCVTEYMMAEKLSFLACVTPQL